ncbi:MAG: N-carbamoylputrescine amidase [Gammaproteobacteria bacterium]|nr:N-carbamoylputrescine amidase [Gammaproteobacteria bacterium]
MTKLTVAATQMTCSWDIEANIDTAESLIREAASKNAQVILIQELFETPYFCIEQEFKHLDLATTVDESPIIKRMATLARELSVVLPVSWFERAGTAFFNSVAMIDADGSVMGVYRKTHIPNAVGYQEKQYFTPGDTGFKVWDTRYAKLGLGICWDQWFPEAARCMALMGAEVLLYPTAIGDEPGDDSVDSMQHWQNVMCGHAGANIMPVVASNRIGKETATTSDMAMTFYGSSFIADQFGNKVEMANRTDQTVLVHEFDLDEIRDYRQTWGVYRDRRPDQYGVLATFDGRLSE